MTGSIASIDGGKRHFQGAIVWTVIGIAWGAISYSYAGSIIGTTLGQPSFIKYMGLATNKHATGLIGTMTGLFYAGGVFGCILNAWMADKFGRKMTVITACVILIISTACLAGSVNIGMFITFRFFVGLGAYMNYLSVPLWVTELVPPKGRSILAGIVGLFGVVGYIVAAYVGVGFFYFKTTTSSQWRAPLAIGCFPPLVLLCMMPWLPESPRWLLAVDREDQAWNIVRTLHTSEDDPEHEYATAEFYQMKSQHNLERHLDSSWLEILRRPSYRKRALLAFFLPVILYSTGNLVITTYAASIFTGLGYNAGQSINLLAGTYLAAIAGNFISLTYVDRVPRNIILSVGVVVVNCVLAIETALVARFLVSDNKAGLSAAAAFLFLFLFCFNLFLEGVSWYYASEIFPTHLRAKGMTITVVGFCLIDILWLEIAPTAITNIGWKYYLVFICLSVVGAAVIYLVYPDTLGKPLEEVAKLFGDDDLVAIYQQNIHIDHEKHEVIVEKDNVEKKEAVEA
ncbi:MFS transporter [Lepidopterella palustris CBS 459.81]|uniref:MFS transporter n=1 Tax=Lepidopterella palustris CBS 459.81 TaxID=1314670 RepID=A0A8E2JAW8_9PEZI|nr:MFS transporter [Lepidopterella palustris CBS 459.81]